MSRRRRRPEAINPFVVLSDVTIALSFILLLYAVNAILQSSKGALQATRDRRQSEVVKRIESSLRDNGYKEAYSVKAAGGSNRWDIFPNRVGRRPLVTVWNNGSFQRIQVFDSFPSGSSTASKNKLYIFMAALIRSSWKELTYVYLHGIADRREKDPDNLSRKRAAFVLGQWQASGHLQKPDELSGVRYREVAARLTVAGMPARIPLKYAASYGSGSLLYADFKAEEDNRRVDVVLFYNDLGKGGDE